MSAGGGVPEAAGIRADLIGQHDGAVRQTAELQLEVDQTDVELQQVLAQNLVDLEGVLADGVDLILCGQAQSQGMVVVDEGIMIVIVLIAELQGGALQGVPSFTPRRLEKLPAATLRTITSRGTI